MKIRDGQYNVTTNVVLKCCSTTVVSVPSAGRQVVLTFTGGDAQKPLQHRGWATPDCQFIDMDDGGLYIRGQHPFDMAPHEWRSVRLF
eukprot:COSAG03_NODE_109_length_12541_cov_147.127070_12_plen_88_part_00